MAMSMPMTSPRAADNGEEDAGDPVTQAARIKEEEMQVRKVQEWWSSEQGPAAVSKSAVLSVIDSAVLAEIVDAGGGYHNILTSDRLDGLYRQVGASTDPALESLRKSLQSRGGSKAQARSVGMLLFREARALCERCEQEGTLCTAPKIENSLPAQNVVAAVATPARSQAKEPAAASPETAVAKPAVIANSEVKLDEVWNPPRRFVCSDAYPPGAKLAVRSMPDSKSECLAELPYGFEYITTGRAGEFLQIRLQLNGISRNAYVLRAIGEMVLLVPAPTEISLDEEFSTPRRYIRGPGYPDGAQMAARLAPSSDGTLLGNLPADFDYHATGRVKDYLRISLDVDGKTTHAFVPHTLGGKQLLVPATQTTHTPTSTPSTGASEAAIAATLAAQAATAAAAAASAASDSRIEVLEKQVQALQKELAQMRSMLSAAGAMFNPGSN